MAVEFDVTREAHNFFLGEDKVIELQIFGQDGETPLNVAGLPMEWSLKKTDKALDPAIIEKSIDAFGVSDPPGIGIEVSGTYDPSPEANLQRVIITFGSDDTDPDVTGLLPTPYTLKATTVYRHSLKRKDPGNESILTFGSFQFRQATER